LGTRGIGPGAIFAEFVLAGFTTALLVARSFNQKNIGTAWQCHDCGRAASPETTLALAAAIEEVTGARERKPERPN